MPKAPADITNNNGRHSQQSNYNESQGVLEEVVVENTKRTDGIQLQIDRIEARLHEFRQDQMNTQSKASQQLMNAEIDRLKSWVN